MKFTIKNIEWTPTEFFNGTGVFCSSLGHYWLQVRPSSNEGEKYRWKIQQGTSIIAFGGGDTLEQCKIDCESAWGKYLEENYLEATI